MLLGVLSLGVTSSHELLVPVLRVLLPPDYSEDEARGDLALLQLRHPVSLSAGIQPVCLPAPGSHPPPGAPCWVTGWGSLHPGGKTQSQAMGTGGGTPFFSSSGCESWSHYRTPAMCGDPNFPSTPTQGVLTGKSDPPTHLPLPPSPLQAMLSPDSQISPSSLSATPRGATLARSEGASTGLSLL